MSGWWRHRPERESNMSTQQLRDQTLALAGIFQATELVQQAANTGQWSAYAAEQSLQSLFELEAASVEDIYAGEFGVNLGLKTLQSSLSGHQENTQSLAYTVELLQLERKYRRQHSMRENIGQQLLEIAAREDNDSQADEHNENRAIAIGELYQNTISTLSTRIMVSGKPIYLQNERTLSWIRSMLFAGLRSSRLWVQLGGSRFDLMFGRKKILAACKEILGT